MDRSIPSNENRRAPRALAILGSLAALAAPFLLPAAALGGAAHPAATHAVSLSGLRFSPATLTIRRGDSVTWSWHAHDTEHNVTFHSTHSRTGSSGSFTVRFPNAGTFSYICTVHVAKGMRGEVIVR